MKIVQTTILVACGFIAYAAFSQADNFPSPENLPANPHMPNPFLKLDGTGPASLGDWPAHRGYLKELLQHYLYGHMPPRPSWKELSFRQTSDKPYSPPNSSIQGRKQEYEVTITRNSLTHSFNFTLYRRSEVKPYPILINNRVDDTFGPEEGVRRGYLFVEFNREEVAPDEPGNADRSEGIFRLYPEPEYDWYTIAAWAWAYQLVIDVVDSLGLVDTGKIMVTGHSRGGQTAMAAAIFDERIDVVAPSTGGPFSLGSHRQRDPDGFRGTWDYPERFKTRQPHWYHPRYGEFSGELQNNMPWDVPTLVALVAPRVICHVNSVDDNINNWLAHEVGIRAGQLIYRWWGMEDRVRIHWRGVSNEYGQTGHDQGREEYEAIYDCGDEFFHNIPGSTRWNVSPGKNTWEYDPDEYPLLIDWTIPEAGLAPAERLEGMRAGVNAWLDPDRSAPGENAMETEITATLKEFDAYLDKTASQLGNSPFAAVVSRNGEILYERYHDGQGVLERTVNKHSRWQIFSITKSFVSALVLDLCQDGLISLDDAIGKYLPAFREHGSGPFDRRAVTIRHLLSHTSGAAVDGNKTPGSLPPGFDEIEIITAPGKEFKYSSLGMLILERTLEASTGMDFEALLNARVIEPLGLKSTGYVYAGSDAERLLPLKKDLFHYSQSGRRAGSGLFTTARDLNAFGQFWLNPESIFSRELWEEAWTHHGTRDTDGGRYGLMWWLFESDGGYVMSGRESKINAVVPETGVVITVIRYPQARPAEGYSFKEDKRAMVLFGRRL